MVCSMRLDVETVVEAETRLQLFYRAIRSLSRASSEIRERSTRLRDASWIYNFIIHLSLNIYYILI